MSDISDRAAFNNGHRQHRQTDGGGEKVMQNREGESKEQRRVLIEIDGTGKSGQKRDREVEAKERWREAGVNKGWKNQGFIHSIIAIPTYP